MNGTFAPAAFEISAISSESVLTMTSSKEWDARACSIVQAISGLPCNNLEFFPGSPFEPIRAGIMPIALFPILNCDHLFDRETSLIQSELEFNNNSTLILATPDVEVSHHSVNSHVIGSMTTARLGLLKQHCRS